MDKEIWLAIVAGSSPFVLGLGKWILDLRKVKDDSSVASLEHLEKRNEWLAAEVERLHSCREADTNGYRAKYDELRELYFAEREKVIRLETRGELRRLIRDENVTELPFHMEDELEFMEPFQAAVDCVVFSNAEGKIIGMNPKARIMFGYVGTDITGQPLSVLMPERYREAQSAGLVQQINTDAASKILRLQGIRADKSEFPIELTITPFQVHNRQYYAAVIRVVEAGALTVSNESAK